MVWGAAGGLCAAAAAVDLVEVAAYRALDPREAHGHALVLVALERRWPQHLALLALLEPLAILEGLTRPREVDLLSYRVAARQRRWWLAAYLCEREVQPCRRFVCILEVPCCLGPRFKAAPPRLALVASAVVVE